MEFSYARGRWDKKRNVRCGIRIWWKEDGVGRITGYAKEDRCMKSQNLDLEMVTVREGFNIFVPIRFVLGEIMNDVNG